MKNRIKHPIQRFRLVEDEFIRNQLIKNFDKKFWQDAMDEDDKYDDGSICFAVCNSFSWEDTHEGVEYWEIVADEINE